MLSLDVVRDVDLSVNRTLTPCSQRCTSNFNPTTADGVDCKQYAAIKLRELLLRGAGPNEFTIWLVRTANAPTAAPDHSVLVHNPTGLVLDVPGPAISTAYGLQRVTILETRAMKERRSGVRFVSPCWTCEMPARASVGRLAVASAGPW